MDKEVNEGGRLAARPAFATTPGIAQKSSLARSPSLAASLSGERFLVSYLLRGDEKQARAMASDICFEQTVEFPEDLVPPGLIRDAIVGRIESLEAVERSGDVARSDAAELGLGAAGQGPRPGLHRATISFAVETAQADIVQLLNVVYGNISIKPNIRVERLDLPESLLANFPGPSFGRPGLRELLGVPTRPLTSTALKPMGLSPAEIADQAYRFALGGIDIIKDDHGILDQIFCPFEERVERCAEAVARANRETGLRSVYMANITGRMDRILSSARRAKELGAGALLICPALTGFDAVRLIAEDAAIGLPIMAHPSFGGVLATSRDSGISHAALYGTLMRLCGADASVYPNFGGRFSFTKEECVGIARATGERLGALKQAFPAPGGGMTPERTAEMLEVYGKDFILLVGAGLHRNSPDLAANARQLLGMLRMM
ncbi:MAG TPA: RuBisCO large subunit C-terminal-like domain-containing protein [Rectinemataceae bacterium]|nr:RuBisCO large subunit C-terminal-like domain-containing protein [Rectinemataceae bacterium]